jgi:hypothetical protein
MPGRWPERRSVLPLTQPPRGGDQDVARGDTVRFIRPATTTALVACVGLVNVGSVAADQCDPPVWACDIVGTAGDDVLSGSDKDLVREQRSSWLVPPARGR